MIRPWFRHAAVPWKTTVTQTRASGENRVSTKPGVLQGGEHAEPHAGPQLGLAEEQDGQRAGGVELGAGQHPDRFQLVVGQQVRLVDQQDRQPASLGELGGQVPGGLRDQGGVVDAGHAAQGRDDRVVDAPGADLRVGDGDELVAGGVQAGGGGARGHGLARADLTGDHRDLAGVDAVGDAADGFLVGGRGEQRPDRDGPVEGQPLESEVAAHGVIDHRRPPGGLGWPRRPQAGVADAVRGAVGGGALVLEQLQVGPPRAFPDSFILRNFMLRAAGSGSGSWLVAESC